MDIQKILLFPENGLNEELFFRTEKGKKHTSKENGCFIFRGSVIDLCTLFNCISIKKWRKYTYVKDIGIRVSGVGKITIQLFQYQYDGHAKQICNAQEIQIENGGIFFPELLDETEIVGLKIVALTDAYLKELSVFSNNESQCEDDPRIALNICTYHRDTCLKHNLEILTSEILNNPDSALYQKLQVFITDNGGNFKLSCLEHESIHLAHENELGSAGGFSCGAKRIISCADQRFTHLIFMDDDIQLSVNALERTYLFLRCLREEYKELTIGGSFMDANDPTIQIESGAVWNEGKVKSLKSGLDMTKLDAIVQNEQEEETSYMGWWYCCVPIICIEKRGYPAPVYFHCDDVEFGLRNPCQLTLNGVCVWHPSFETKPSSINKYYDIRNLAVVNAIHCPQYTKWKYLRSVWQKTIVELLRFRYKDAKLVLQGALDFCQGKEWILKHDSGELYRHYKEQGYTLSNIHEFAEDFDLESYRSASCTSDPKWKKYTKMIFANGIFLPSSRKAILPAFEPPVERFWLVKTVLNYNSYDKTGFLTKRSVKETIEILRKLLHCSAVIIKKFAFAEETWKEKVGKTDE